MIIGIAALIITLILTHEPPSLLEKRFNNNANERQESPLMKMMIHLQEVMKPISQKNAQSANYISKSKKLLLQAGYASSEEDVIKYDAKRLATILIIAVVCLILLILSFDTLTIVSSLLFIYVFYKLPEMKLKAEIKKRQKDIIRYLPDAVDLLSICIQAGLGLDSAFEKVADEFKLTSPTVSTEFSRLNKDILSGFNREDAYKNLLLRNEVQDLQSFVALLIQTDRLGTSITQSLNSFCDSMRTKKRQRIEELSQQASVKMTVPMVLFMLPAIFIIILFPAAVKIAQGFGGG